MSFAVAIHIRSDYSVREAADRISEMLLGGIPFIDGESHFDAVYDEVPFLRSSRSVLGHFVDLVGSAPNDCEMFMRSDFLTLSVNPTHLVADVSLTAYLVEVLNGIEGMHATSTIIDVN